MAVKPAQLDLLLMGWTDRALNRTFWNGGQLTEGAWTMTRKATGSVTITGIDIGKNSFHLIGLDDR